MVLCNFQIFVSDCEIIRCVLKILVAVYQKIYKVKYKSIRRSRSKSGSGPSTEHSTLTNKASLSEEKDKNMQKQGQKPEHDTSNEQSDTNKIKDSLLDEEQEKEIYTVLHENIQGLLVDLIKLIHKVRSVFYYLFRCI